ncbi:NLR family CARD domain-containing protein 4 [Holothuria leucospilota]|uniref:NLR family CARD domain-containing protein 4 n=1 Tax=Holothuria leucospilota TaxID=206669 RepID=A0A9Q1CAW0_HOLLE|nr:NLR family CARD domain-containing protein 4 [Holothuria leucospilota]
MNLILPTILIIWLSQCTSGADLQEGCEPLQYLELGQRGTIQCYFREGFLGVFWYESEDFANDDPILSYKDSEISGAGYKSGEFSIWPNGSLIINNVSIAHDHVYTAIKLNTLDDDPFPHTVNVTTTVTPKQLFPAITECGNEHQFCLRSLHPSYEISCSVDNARPMLELYWFERTTSDDIKIFTETNVTSEGNRMYTSRITTKNYFSDEVLLKLLVCKVISSPSFLRQIESMVLVQRNDKTLPSYQPVTKYFERNSKLELYCTDTNNLFVVWRVKRRASFRYENLAYAILAKYNFTGTFADKYELGDTASLIIPQVQVEDEGFYDCISGDGTSEDITSYHIGVYVVPDSSYPVVEGCENQNSCFLEVEHEGTLTCAVKGIRPQVELEWKVVYKDTSHKISFTKQQLTVKDNGHSFDVSLKATYFTNLRYENIITVECTVSGPHATLFDLSRRVDLLFVTSTTEEVPEGKGLLWLLVITVPLVFFVLVSVLMWKGCRRRRRQKLNESTHDDEEALPMTQTKNREVFIQQLKAKYEEMYAAILPIPYIRDRYYRVDKIFINGGIEFLPSNEIGKETWQTIDSYQSIFDDCRIKSSRIILEGYPGYGKSTLTLQMAYDWCNQTSQSRLDGVGILILLQLRKLGGVTSIFDAIRNFILPIDTTLNLEDIQNIVTEYRKTGSMLVILDGYDEFPDQDQETDVRKILERKMFQDCDVILTTRPSHFPRNFSPYTKRVRLTGFDEEARQKYISKSVTRDETNGGNIERRLKKNPVLKDLCQVPLFFVMFAHITQDRKDDLKFNSVTIYFQYMVSCFHKHMQNKIEEKDLREKYEQLEHNHGDLDQVAFENLRQIDQDLVLETNQLLEKIGENCYELYVRIGILVEENVIKVRDRSSARNTPFIQDKKQVRFYHRLFREWYAAHYLSNHITEFPAECEYLLKKLPPSKLPDIYRFVCGLNLTAAEEIIRSLELAGNTKFKLLCMLERDGKVDNILNTLKEECADRVNIRNDDDILKQKSILQLIKIASHHKIPLTTVWLWYSFNSVDTTAKNIILKSGLSLPNLQAIEEIVIVEEGREIEETEMASVFEFAIKCATLESLGFSRCLLPCCVTSTYQYTLNLLQSKGVKVWWYPTMDSPRIPLNLDSGRWKDPEEGTDITDKAYSEKVDKFRDHWSYTPWQVARGAQQ